MTKIAKNQRKSQIQRAVQFLISLRTPRAVDELMHELGFESRRNVYKWLNEISQVVTIGKKEYRGDGTRSIVKYFWDESCLPVKSYYRELRSLDGCLFILGAQEKEIKKAKNSFGTIDYKIWVSNLFKQCVTRNKPSESPPGMIDAFIQARNRANHILDWR